MAENKAVTVFRKKFELWRPRLEVLVPRQVGAERLLNLALSAISRNELLRSTIDNPHTQTSILKSCIGAAQLGVEIDTPLGEAFILPFYSKKLSCYIAQLVMGYPGLVNLGYRSGMIEAPEARVVFEGDLFEYAFGTNAYIKHEPAKPDQRGEVVAFYAILWVKGSTHPLFEVMPREDVEAVRDASPAGKNPHGPWRKHPIPMGQKTVLKRVYKYAPKSPELTRAIKYDNLAEAEEPQFDFDLGDIDEAETANGSRTQKLKDKLTNGPKADDEPSTEDNQAPPEDDQTPPSEPSPGPPEAGHQADPGEEEAKKKQQRRSFAEAVLVDGKCMNRQCVSTDKRNQAALHPHHLVPRSQRGPDEVENGITLCVLCHKRAHEGYETAQGRVTGRRFLLTVLEGWRGELQWRWDKAYEWLSKKEPEKDEKKG